MPRDTVDNSALRSQALGCVSRGELSWQQISDLSECGAVSNLKRRLGIVCEAGVKEPQRYVSYAVALRIGNALAMDPIDAGL